MDKTQVNLERIRAVDAWEENKHPRSENGQFTSGSGGGGAAQALKNVASAVGGSHPMAAEVQKDIDYWNMTHYNNNPSEKQKADTIESMKAQYESAMKSAENNYKLALKYKVPDETAQEFKAKYEKARGKVEALAQMQSGGQKDPVMVAKRFDDIAAAYKRADSDVAKYAKMLSSIAKAGGEEAAQKWVESRLKKIDESDWNPVKKGYHRGRLNMVMEQYKK